MNTPPPIQVSAQWKKKPTQMAVSKGVLVGVGFTVSMSLCSWFGLSRGDDSPFQDLMTVLNLLPILFVMGGAKGRAFDDYVLGFLIVVQWAVIGTVVGFLAAWILGRRRGR